MRSIASQPDGTLSATVEFTPGAEPISGRVSDPAGIRHPFSGWLELIVALQRANAGDVDRRHEKEDEP